MKSDKSNDMTFAVAEEAKETPQNALSVNSDDEKLTKTPIDAKRDAVNVGS